MINREEYLNELIRWKDKDLIKVVTGIRRCGKSTLFELFIDYLKKEGFYMILSNCSSENPASKRIMEKSNMTLDAVLKNRLTSRFDKNNDRADIYCFSY